MGLLDEFGSILNQYSGAGTPPQSAEVNNHYAQVAPSAPPSVLSGALSEIFKSPQTGTFGQNVSSMFGNSNPQQRTGILDILRNSAGGGSILQNLGLGGAGPITPQQAQQVSPEVVEQAANQAQQQDPSIIDRASDFYSKHPTLVQAIGTGAAIIAMQHISRGRG